MNKEPDPDMRGFSRRVLLKLAIGAASAIMGVALGIPMVAALIGPSLKKKKAHWTRVSEVSVLAAGEPASLPFADFTEEAYIHEDVIRTVWAVRGADNEIKVFSPICPHLGCHYDWHPERDQFVCPCHGSVFAPGGQVVAGPAPRPLDTLPSRIEKGILFVKWERFETGIAAKVRV